MNEGKRLLHLSHATATVTALICVIVIYVLFRVSVKEQGTRLLDMANGHARLISAILVSDLAMNASDRSDAEVRLSEAAQVNVLRRLAGSDRSLATIGRTGELVLARRSGDEIVFLLPHRFPTLNHSMRVRWSEPVAEPMRVALSQGVGAVLIATDYRGEQVIAATARVSQTNWGVVAKVDLAEILGPFRTAWLVTGVVAVLLILLSSSAIVRVNRPFLHRLQISEERIAAVLEHAADGIITINPRGTILSYNIAAEEMFQYTVEEAVGKNVTLLMPRSYSKEHDGNLRRYLETGNKTVIGMRREVQGLRKDGSAFPMEIHVSEVNDGVEPIFTSIITDITQRRLEEDAQRANSEVLLSMNEELELATAQAQASTNAKSEFLANMSHEIRTPMTAILGFAESLLEGNSTREEQIESLRTIHRNGTNLLAIVNDILDISKVEAGRMTMESVVTSPDGIVEEVVELMQVRAKAKSLTLNYLCDASVPKYVKTDPTRLRQILINLVGNAIKFTQQGSVIIELHADDAPEGGLFLHFDVIDTGIGLAENEFALIFEPFVQADGSHTRRFGGTGLGLALSRRLSRLLGGDVEVIYSAPGKGTQFRVTISAEPCEAPVTQTRDHRPNEQLDRRERPTGSPQLPPCSILLVEDGLDNQRLLTLVLNKAGADVAVAENGQVAIDMVVESNKSGQPYDVILMDIQMPVFDGYEATRRLRELGWTNAIIALTAHAMAGDKERCLAAGCDDYATKPIDRKALIETIRSYLPAHACASGV